MSRPARWSPAVAALHWLNAALIFVLLGLGWAMTRGLFAAGTTFDLYQLHKSLGLTALALTAVRLAARGLTLRPPPAAGLDGRLAGAVQTGFYVLTLAAIGTGWLVVSTSPLPVPTRLFGLVVVPDLAGPDPELFAASALGHRAAAVAIAALLVLHCAGALKHLWIDRDDTLARILPARGREGGRRG